VSISSFVVIMGQENNHECILLYDFRSKLSLRLCYLQRLCLLNVYCDVAELLLRLLLEENYEFDVD
jgi:hypothetical protein